MEIVQSAFGLVALTALAWLFSENRCRRTRPANCHRRRVVENPSVSRLFPDFERRGLIVALGPKTLVSGTLATCLTGAVIGVLI